MKTYHCFIAWSLISLSLSFAEDHESLCVIERVHDGKEAGALYLVDGKLLFYVNGSEQRHQTATPYEAIAWTFKYSKTDRGTLLSAYPKGIGAVGKSEKNTTVDGFYLTADYSSEPYTVKLTKDPEKASYWDAPEYGGIGHIRGIDEKGSRVSLRVGNTTVRKINPTETGDLEYRDVVLSMDEGEPFRIKKLKSDDISR
jgi:hypothetical protein